MNKTWVIGSDSECDVAVSSPTVSRRHCRLVKTAYGEYLRDLGSSNGTYVNGIRIDSIVRIGAGDQVTLGSSTPLPRPGSPGSEVRVLSIGRTPENDVVVEDARVSGRHARLFIVSPSEFWIEDVGSANGTFLNSLDKRLSGPEVVSHGDVLSFGSLNVPLGEILRKAGSIQAPSGRGADRS